MTLLNDDYRGRLKAFLTAARLHRRISVKVSVILRLVVSRYDALGAAKDRRPVMPKAAGFSSLLAFRMSA